MKRLNEKTATLKEKEEWQQAFSKFTTNIFRQVGANYEDITSSDYCIIKESCNKARDFLSKVEGRFPDIGYSMTNLVFKMIETDYGIKSFKKL